ncbi:type II toxin-antitoxin system RelE/ParE family toxin [Methylocucumis oryzae]|uniref:Toxin n=1 Tax=Methylocucumis oryzae TaxID=1632867 RepID=A0A0F3IHM5_9GAMM|nr:type II toxin-antitoxin system RelE/ParE family toxin [Methylocucumis oryzae]KJV04959.1 plasmid stabilization protein [Methylocucumis oryzae]
MPVIIKRPRALSDLAEIWDYIADDSETRADSFVATIDAKFHILAEQPKIGRLRDELAAGLRSFPIGRYVIFYLPFADGVDIVRVLHGSRDIDTIFHDDN